MEKMLFVIVIGFLFFVPMVKAQDLSPKPDSTKKIICSMKVPLALGIDFRRGALGKLGVMYYGFNGKRSAFFEILLSYAYPLIKGKTSPSFGLELTFHPKTWIGIGLQSLYYYSCQGDVDLNHGTPISEAFRNAKWQNEKIVLAQITSLTVGKGVVRFEVFGTIIPGLMWTFNQTTKKFNKEPGIYWTFGAGFSFLLNKKPIRFIGKKKFNQEEYTTLYTPFYFVLETK